VVVPQQAPQPVSVGGEPVGIAAAESSLWVSGGSSGEAVRIDTATRTVTARVAVGGALGGIAATRGAVWVSVFDGGQVARIDPAAGSVVARVAVGGEPTAIAFDPSGMVWVGNLDGNLDRIDPATSQVTASLILPTGVSTLLPRGNLIWIGLQNRSLVTLDPATATLVGAPVAVAPDVDALAETPDGLWASTFDGLAARIDTTARRVVRRVRLPSRGGGVAYANGRVWVSAYDSGFAVALDPVSGVYLAAVHTGLEPRDSVVVGSTLWIADQGSGEVTPIAP
jgi:streptogramin lyase